MSHVKNFLSGNTSVIFGMCLKLLIPTEGISAPTTEDIVDQDLLTQKKNNLPWKNLSPKEIKAIQGEIQLYESLLKGVSRKKKKTVGNIYLQKQLYELKNKLNQDFAAQRKKWMWKQFSSKEIESIQEEIKIRQTIFKADRATLLEAKTELKKGLREKLPKDIIDQFNSYLELIDQELKKRPTETPTEPPKVKPFKPKKTPPPKHQYVPSRKYPLTRAQHRDAPSREG